jgi:FKBP-type peptidyl-prolyl cis-trans isomerase 2
MAKIKKGDFVEVEYTGRLKDTDEVFDTTDEALAKETGIHRKEMVYGPVAVCIGQAQLIKGLDDEMAGKETGKSYKVELAPEQAFGKRDAKLFKVVPFSAFTKHRIVPEPGMQVNIDGMLGIIKTSTGGRCMVDFNHPLAGRALVYDIKANRVVTDDKEKIKSFLGLELGLKDAGVEIKEGKAVITLKKEMPKEAGKLLSDKLKEIIPGVKEFVFTQEKKK